MISIPLYLIEKELFKRKAFKKMDISEKQAIALEALHDNMKSEIVYGGGAGGGKSFLGAIWLFFSCLLYPETRWFVGRKELKQLRFTTYETFKKVFAKYEFPSDQYNFNGKDNYFLFANGSRIDFVELKYMPSDPLFEGLGSTEYTGGWIEEGGEIVFDAYDTIKSRVGRQHNDKYFPNQAPKILITCNPKKNWIYKMFYKPFKDKLLEATKDFIQSLLKDNPFIEKQYKKNLEGLKDKSKKARLLDGEWEYEDDPSSLLEYEEILAVFSNEYVANHAARTMYITADIALMGVDKFRIGVWRGWELVKLITRDISDGEQVVELIRETAKKHKVQQKNICYDSDGIGMYLQGYLGEAFPFKNNARPFEKEKQNPENSTAKTDNYFVENYRNLKAQCAFHLAHKISKGDVYVSAQLSEKDKEEMIEELELLKNTSYGTENPLDIPKKEAMKQYLGRSPDILDMMLMKSVFDLKKKKMVELPFFTG